MRRTISLQNVLYKRKYREVYKLVFNADLDEVNDHSTWMYNQSEYCNTFHPLWIIVESKILNKRMWITNSFNTLEIATAQLDLDCNSRAYHDSYKRYHFSNQKELCEKLEEILKPCLKEYYGEITKEQDLEYEKD